MTIHSDHPFADPDPDPARRLRGRLGGAVTLWTAASGDVRAGLTVTSMLVALGEPPRVLGLLDPDSDLAATLEASGRGVVSVLTWGLRGLAEAFAGQGPVPGGPFRQAVFEPTPWGPRPAAVQTWAGVIFEGATDVGWSRLVTCRVDEVHLGEEEPLVHRRGRYLRPRDESGGD